MILEARAKNCFSTTFVLKRDSRPIGKFEGRWLSESLDIYVTKRRRLEFRKLNWLGSRFELIDGNDGQVLGSCNRSGLLTSSWDLSLSAGDAQLVKAGWFQTAYDLVQAHGVLARVDRLGWCERGWAVDGSDDLPDEDLLLIGLVYHTIQERQARQQHAGGHAAGS
jgi:hypothetical protein